MILSPPFGLVCCGCRRMAATPRLCMTPRTPRRGVLCNASPPWALRMPGMRCGHSHQAATLWPQLEANAHSAFLFYSVISQVFIYYLLVLFIISISISFFYPTQNVCVFCYRIYVFVFPILEGTASVPLFPSGEFRAGLPSVWFITGLLRVSSSSSSHSFFHFIASPDFLG